MSHYYPDDHPAFDFPWFNPEPVEKEVFPVVHNIEYVGGIRVHRALTFIDGRTRLGWACGHGQFDATPEGAAADCAQYCHEEDLEC